MSQSPLNKKWFHKVIDYFFPNNCRALLEAAIIRNKAASAELFKLIANHEHDVINGLKSDRRQHIRKL